MRTGDYVRYECLEEGCSIDHVLEGDIGRVGENVVTDRYRVTWYNRDDEVMAHTIEKLPKYEPGRCRIYQVKMTEDGPIEVGTGFGVDDTRDEVPYPAWMERNPYE